MSKNPTHGFLNEITLINSFYKKGSHTKIWYPAFLPIPGSLSHDTYYSRSDTVVKLNLFLSFIGKISGV